MVCEPSCGTRRRDILRQHEADVALCETRFALLTQKRLIWGVLRSLGDFSLAHAINQLRRASFVSP